MGKKRTINLPDEKVYSVRLKKCVHADIMERLESGIPQYILVDALERYFHDRTFQKSESGFEHIQEQLDELKSLLKPHHSQNHKQSTADQGTPTSVSFDDDPLMTDIESSLLELLNE